MSRVRLRRLLLAWVFSRLRWINSVCVEAFFGLVFLAAPDLTTAVLEIQPSREASMLFRLYGTGLLSRGLLHHATFAVPHRRVVLQGLIADITLSLPSAVLLLIAIASDLAGGATWAVAGLFTLEALLQIVALTGLWSVSTDELQRALSTK